jgi:hypothetical protein
VLSSFEITNFRTFSHLRIQRFGSVNLIVGKNNVGKTTLLEALHVYAADNPRVVQVHLTDHEEFLFLGTLGETYLDYQSLFQGRAAKGGRIVLGLPQGGTDGTAASERLTMDLIPMDRVEDSEGRPDFNELHSWDEEPEGVMLPGLRVRRDGRPVLISTPRRRQIPPEVYGAVYVRAGETPAGLLQYWWNSIAATDYETQVVDSMSMIARLESVRLVDDPTRIVRLAGGPTLSPGRIFLVRIEGEAEPMPLKSLGGGPMHMFRIATAAAFAARMPTSHQQSGEVNTAESPNNVARKRPNVLLIDEIENGIHYTLHAKLWRLIFGLTERYNLQVFATSHSWDCIEGFQKALATDTQTDGLLIRLEKVEGEQQTGAVIIDRDALPVVVRDAIEVR